MDDARTILILTGARDWDRAHKTFSKPANTGDKPNKVSDYHMGKFFCWRTERLTEGVELESLIELLGRLGDEQQSFLVPGLPLPFLVPGELIHRRKAFIDAPLVPQLLRMDIDGWDTGVAWWESQEALGTAIRLGFEQRGLDYLCTAPMVVMLTQGAWPGHDLRCRVYLWLQEPITLDDQRRWAKVVNARLGAVRGLDPIVYGQVHIDYTSKRQCQDFTDPFPESLRLTLHTADELTLTEEQPHAGIRRELQEAPATITSSSLPDDFDAQGDGWEMLRQTGKNNSMNTWGYRAAAKIVREEGKAYVEAHLDELAEKMHTLAWSVVHKNSNGERGHEDDAATQTVAKYRQYLYSACEATIGDDLDDYLGILRRASDGGGASLFSTESIDAAARLYKGWIGHYTDFRNELIRSRRVRAKDWDNAVQRCCREIDKKRRVSAREVDDALDALDGTPTLVGEVLDEDGNLLELPFFTKIAETYDWVGDGTTAYFIDRLDQNAAASGGYRVTDQARVVGEFAIRGMEILNSVAPTLSLPQGCRAAVASLIDRKMKETADKQGRVPSLQWGFRDLCQRYKFTGEVLWVNLGIEEDRYNCMRCTVEGVKRMTWIEAFKYDDAPVWVGGTVPLKAGDNDPNSLAGLELAASGLVSMDEGAWTRDLFRLVKLASSDDEIYILTWLMSVILDWETRFILQLRGTKGVGKSTTGDMLCALVDPLSDTEVLKHHQGRRLPVDILSEDKKLMISLASRNTAMIDNVSSLSGRQQDRLCMLASGFGVDREIKYTHITQSYNIRCSLILTGITESDTRSDFGDRVLHATIRGGDYIPVRIEFERLQGGIVDGLLRMAMLVKQEVVRTNANDRKGLVDAVGKVYMGIQGRQAIQSNRTAATFNRVQNSAFASTFMAWVQHDSKSWGTGGALEGKWLTATELHEAYRAWFNASVGDNFTVSHPAGGYFVVYIGSRRHDKQQPMPSNAVHFSRQMTKWLPDVSDVVTHFLPTSLTPLGWVFKERIKDGMKLRQLKTTDEFLV